MITVFGLGFVGITTALYFSEKVGINVYGVDKDVQKIEMLNNSKLPFSEDKLEELLKRNINKKFFISKNLKDEINKSKYIFICVDTSMKEDGSADLSSVFNVLDEIINKVDKSTYRTIIIKSSIPPTTTEKTIIPYIETNGLTIGVDIGLCVNPEFLREGCSYNEIENPNHIIIGCNDKNTKQQMYELYKHEKNNIFNVNYSTAEFIKYLSNSLLANLISFANEMAVAAEKLGNIEVKEAFNILKLDNRWNDCEMKNYVHPIGKYGGYCLPKDTNALYNIIKKSGFDSKILKSTISINNELEEHFVQRIISEVKPQKKIGILGLSFKPNSDDVRDTSSYYVIKKLKENNYNSILAYDPISINNFRETYSNLEVEYIYEYKKIIEKSDVLIILTIWPEFKNIKKITEKLVIDFTHKI